MKISKTFKADSIKIAEITDESINKAFRDWYSGKTEIIIKIKETIKLQQELEADHGIIAINSNRSEGKVKKVQILHLSDFLSIASELSEIAEQTSHDGELEQLSYVRDGIAFFTLMDDKEDRRQWENMKKRHRL